MSRMQKRTLLLCLSVLGFSCTDQRVPLNMTVPVRRGDLIFAGSFYGEIEARESHAIFVPQFQNVWQVTIESVLLDGTHVKEGETVLTFAKSTFEQDLRERESELAVATASSRKVKEQQDDEAITRTLAIQRAEMAIERAKLAVVEGVNLISKLDLEKAKVELAQAKLQLETEKKSLAAFEKQRAATLEIERLKVAAATTKVEEIRSQLGRMEVKAPAAGILYAPYTRLNWVMGKAVPGKVARPGDKLLELPELDRFNASVYVRQRDASLVRVGDTATITVTMLPDRSFKGRVVSKDEFATTRNERIGTTTPEGNLKEVKVVLQLEETTAPLRPGGTVRADISTVLARQVLLAPLAALHETRGEYRARLRGGSWVHVKVGLTSTTHAEIREGLSVGDELLLN